MTLPNSEVQTLAYALIDEALGENEAYADAINIDQFKTVFLKHEDLVEKVSERCLMIYCIISVSSATFISLMKMLFFL